MIKKNYHFQQTFSKCFGDFSQKKWIKKLIDQSFIFVSVCQDIKDIFTLRPTYFGPKLCILEHFEKGIRTFVTPLIFKGEGKISKLEGGVYYNLS